MMLPVYSAKRTTNVSLSNNDAIGARSHFWKEKKIYNIR